MSKLGLIFRPLKTDWHVSHAKIPTPLLLDDRIRVFYTAIDTQGRSNITYVDLNRDHPTEILHSSLQPIMKPGKVGTFDDCGVSTNSLIDLGDKIYMYYHGWNKMVTTPYRNTIGLAISSDRGKTFERYSLAPIIDRTKDEPFFNTSPWVLKDKNIWHMWYACITDWIQVNNKLEPLYHIKYAHSKDGIEWQRDNISCILPLTEHEANVRPTVIKHNNLFKMIYCYRGSNDFRDGKDSYKLGYAESLDGKNWTRKDNDIDMSAKLDDWDEKMQAYPALIQVENKYYLFYNGNGFGFEGFGCAHLEFT